MNKKTLMVLSTCFALSVCANAQTKLDSEMACFGALYPHSWGEALEMTRSSSHNENGTTVVEEYPVGAMLRSQQGGQDGFYVYSPANVSFYQTPAIKPLERNEFGGVYSYNYWEFPAGPGLGECRFMAYSVPGGDDAKADPNPSIGFACNRPAPGIKYIRLNPEQASNGVTITRFREELLTRVQTVTRTYISTNRHIQMLTHGALEEPKDRYFAALTTCRSVKDAKLSKAIEIETKTLEEVPAKTRGINRPGTISGGMSQLERIAGKKDW